MKSKRIAFLTLALFATLHFQSSTVCAQGPLAPPGVPAPTMKTLNQIEPRIPISSVPYVITNAGSYYLTTNLTVINSVSIAISIQTSDVTLDFCGWTLDGAGLAIVGVQAVSMTNITVTGGAVRRFQGNGVNVNYVTGAVITRMQLIGNDTGLGFAGGARIEDCLAVANANHGFVGQYNSIPGSILRRCRAIGNGVTGIIAQHALIEDCLATQNGTGFVASGGLTTSHGLNRCVALANTNAGFSLENGQARDCVAIENGTGFNLVQRGTLLGCTALNNQTGFVATVGGVIRGSLIQGNRSSGGVVSNNCIVAANQFSDNATVTTTQPSLQILGSGNQILDNSIQGTNDYAIVCFPTNNVFLRNVATGHALLGYNVTSTGNLISVASGTDSATNTNPHVNFSVP